ncbi:hypothetical protein RSAG8_09037, partial [Rhizoctonia solani AG-8 WAC10335]
MHILPFHANSGLWFNGCMSVYRRDQAIKEFPYVVLTEPGPGNLDNVSRLG